jgi:peptidoglycan/xylan/chitin deacetylase (PgdA/CDA1 family)
LAARGTSSHVPVLFYHGVRAGPAGGVLDCERKHLPAEELERQLLSLLRSRRVVPLREYARALRGGRPLPPRCAVLTFDDGYENNFTIAYPLLRKHSLPATFFVSSGFVEGGGPLWFDRLASAFEASVQAHLEDPFSGLRRPLGTPLERIAAYRAVKASLKGLEGSRLMEAVSDVERRLCGGSAPERDLFRPMTPAQLRELASGGLIEVGSHGLSHRALTTLSREEAFRELRGSRERIAALSGAPVESFSYPNGDFNPEVARLAEEAGYACAAAGGLRLNPPRGVSPYAISRLALAEGDSEALIEATLAGLRGWAIRALGGTR